MFDIKYIRENLYKTLSEAEPEEEDADDGLDDLFSDEDIESADDSEETDPEEDNMEDETVEDSETESEESFTSDQDKVNKLYKDTGNPELDYSLTNPNNVRLYAFKFKNAGIDPFSLMSETEQTEGLRSDELEARLTPEQLNVYKEKNSDLRNEFKLISEREMNIAIYNSNTPLLVNDQKGNSVSLRHPNDQKQAIGKLADYMTRNFGNDWVDNRKAISFLQNIKVNFSEDPKIRPNLVGKSIFETDEETSIIHFNKLFSEIPESVNTFIKENQDSEEYKKSSIFRTLVDDFKGSGVGGSRTSIYPVIRNESLSEGEETAPEGTEEDNTDEGAGDLGGGDFGGAEEGGEEGLGTEETPDEGGDTEEQ